MEKETIPQKYEIQIPTVVEESSGIKKVFSYAFLYLQPDTGVYQMFGITHIPRTLTFKELKLWILIFSLIWICDALDSKGHDSAKINSVFPCCTA